MHKRGERNEVPTRVRHGSRAQKSYGERGKKAVAIAYSHHARPCSGATYFYDRRARARTLSRAASWNILFVAHPSADETG